MEYLSKRLLNSFTSIAKAAEDLLNQSTELRQCQCPKVPKMTPSHTKKKVVFLLMKLKIYRNEMTMKIN